MKVSTKNLHFTVWMNPLGCLDCVCVLLGIYVCARHRHIYIIIEGKSGQQIFTLQNLLICGVKKQSQNKHDDFDKEVYFSHTASSKGPT